MTIDKKAECGCLACSMTRALMQALEEAKDPYVDTQEVAVGFVRMASELGLTFEEFRGVLSGAMATFAMNQMAGRIPPDGVILANRARAEAEAKGSAPPPAEEGRKVH